MLYDPLSRQIQHPPQRIVARKTGFVLGDLPELPVQAFDNVRCVYDFPNLRRVFKKGTENLPVFLPASDTGRILLPPGVGELAQIFLRLVQGDGGIDLLQVGGHFLDVFVADILGGAADLVYDAPLQTALGIYRLNGLHHAAQAVGAEQINIQNAPAFEIIQHVQPKFAALMLSDPHAQNVLPTVHSDAQNYIGRLGHITVILLDLVVDGVHEDEGIDGLQGPILPGVDLWHDFFTDLAHQFRRNLHVVQALDLLGNVPLAHAAGVQGQDLVLHALGVPVVFADDLRFVIALPVSGYF